ncbi:hypothetical protein GCM10017752_44500 [Streptomyces roseoviridis]
MTRIARGLVGTALAVALAGVAGCGGGSGTPDGPTETTQTPTGSAEPGGTAELFPGGGGQAAPAHVPTAKVREKKRVPVHVRNTSDGSVPLGTPRAAPNDHKTLAQADRGTCPEVLPGGGSCVMNLDVTPLEEGSFSGEMTFESGGTAVVVPYSGEAVGDGPTDTGSPTSESPLPTDTTPTETTDPDTDTDTDPSPDTDIT